jgi:hypothetical protein
MIETTKDRIRRILYDICPKCHRPKQKKYVFCFRCRNKLHLKDKEYRLKTTYFYCQYNNCPHRPNNTILEKAIRLGEYYFCSKKCLNKFKREKIAIDMISFPIL